MKPRNSTLYLYIILGMLSAFGPFVTDFYLPALPELNSDFNTTPSMVQLSLTVCMVGLALGQLVVGPLSDRYGRKRPLLASLLLFLIATAGCIFAPTIGWFIASRLIQGVAGAGSLVLSKSIATDLYEGDELARFFSILVPIQGIAPVAAPGNRWPDHESDRLARNFYSAIRFRSASGSRRIPISRISTLRSTPNRSSSTDL